jgi:hypothetical protein
MGKTFFVLLGGHHCIFLKELLITGERARGGKDYTYDGIINDGMT